MTGPCAAASPGGGEAADAGREEPESIAASMAVRSSPTGVPCTAVSAAGIASGAPCMRCDWQLASSAGARSEAMKIGRCIGSTPLTVASTYGAGPAGILPPGPLKTGTYCPLLHDPAATSVAGAGH